MSRVVLEQVRSEEAPQVVNYNALKPKETMVVSIPQIEIPPLFPERLKKKKDDSQFKKFFTKFSSLSLNIPLMEALQEMSGYAKFMKDLVKRK